MLRSGEAIKGLAIRATDGKIGTVDQLLFDDERWAVRYMVVNTAGWLLKELVLLSPRSIAGVDWEARQVAVNLRRQQVEDAPSIATDAPVSRQMEAELASYYSYQPYWYGPGLWGAGAYSFVAPSSAGSGSVATTSSCSTSTTGGRATGITCCFDQSGARRAARPPGSGSRRGPSSTPATSSGRMAGSFSQAASSWVPMLATSTTPIMISRSWALTPPPPASPAGSPRRAR